MSARASLFLSFAPFAIAVSSAACDDSLKSVSLIEETRVLGARVEVETDPSRSSPGPGERAALRLFSAAPNGELSFAYALSVCAALRTNNGFPPCASAPFASVAQLDPGDTEARLDFQVPEDVDLAGTPHAFASGLFCPDSGLFLNPDAAPKCLTGAGIEVAFEFDLGGHEQGNHNPSFSADALTLDGEPWPASSEASCDGDALRQLPTRSRHVLSFDLADTDFEALPQPTSLDPARETLLLSPFSTDGKLDHGFLSLNADTPAEQRRVSWDAPGVTGSVPRLVRFYFVVRDARGGQDFTSRSLCVVP